MTSKLLAALIGALLALPVFAQARQSRPPADPADPGAAVPPTVYRSVIAPSAPAPQDGQPTPDKNWRAANDAVGHSGHAGAGSEPHRHGHAAAPAPAAPATPAPPARPAPVDHSKHH